MGKRFPPPNFGLVMAALVMPWAHTPVPVRAFVPTYASWTTAPSDLASERSGEENLDPCDLGDHTSKKRRFAVQAQVPSIALLKLLHRMTGHQIPLDCQLGRVGQDSVVRVLGWRESRTRTGQAHLVYTVLAAAPSRLMSEAEKKSFPDLSEARLVHRRYRDFCKLHAALCPHAQRAGLLLPPLPSKISAFGRNLSPEVGAQRQKALHDWLSWVACQPALICDELRLFLGLSPLAPPGSEPATPQTITRCSSATEDAAMTDEHKIAVNLAELEAKAIETMLDDALWGR